MYHETEVLLQVCFQAAPAKAPIRALVDRNLDSADTLPVRLAMLAPDAAVTKLKAGKQLGLASYGQFHWRMSAVVVAQLAEAHSCLLGRLADPPVCATRMAGFSKSRRSHQRH